MPTPTPAHRPHVRRTADTGDAADTVTVHLPGVLRVSLLMVLAAVVALVPLLGSAAPASAAAPSRPAGLPVAVDPYAQYVPAVSCDARAKVGATAFGNLLRSTWRGTSFNVPRACGSDALSTSEHYDGRAVDWFVTVRSSSSKAQAEQAIAWLLATDSRGNRHANARRLGVMYIIWNNRIWGAYSAGSGWRDYNGCSKKTARSADTTCHRDHVHFSLSWAGANKHTSWWTKKVGAPEFGPCRVADLNWAAPRGSSNFSRCPSYAKVAAKGSASALGKRLVAYSGVYVAAGSNGPVVSAVQQALGVKATGSFTAATRTALVRWQTARKIPATGVTDVNTWRAMVYSSTTRPVVPATVTTKPAPAPKPPAPQPKPTTPAPKPTTPAPQPKPTTPAPKPTPPAPQPKPTTPAPTTPTPAKTPPAGPVGPGITGDALPDVLSRTADGRLWVQAGTTNAGLGAPVPVPGTWGQYAHVFAPGDATGDGRTDLVAVTAAGTAYLLAGHNNLTFDQPRQVGTGWGTYRQFVTVGDLTGDGRPDILAVDSSGHLRRHASTGAGTWAGQGLDYGAGWDWFEHLTGVGDLNGDGVPDLVAVAPGGSAYTLHGSAGGRFTNVAATGVRLGGYEQLLAVDVTNDGLADLLGVRPDRSVSVHPRSGSNFAATGRPSSLVPAGHDRFTVAG